MAGSAGCGGIYATVGNKWAGHGARKATTACRIRLAWLFPDAARSRSGGGSSCSRRSRSSLPLCQERSELESRPGDAVLRRARTGSRITCGEGRALSDVPPFQVAIDVGPMDDQRGS